MFSLSCCPYWTNSAAIGINPTIMTPDTTIAKLLMAPCSSLAFNDSAVPMAWEAAPGRLTLTNRKSIRKAREGLFFLSNLSVIFCVTSRDLL